MYFHYFRELRISGNEFVNISKNEVTMNILELTVNRQNHEKEVFSLLSRTLN